MSCVRQSDLGGFWVVRGWPAAVLLLGVACTTPRPAVVAALPRQPLPEVVAESGAPGSVAPKSGAAPVTAKHLAPTLAGNRLLARTQAAASERGWFGRTLDTVSGDYAEFYDSGTLLALGGGVGLGALGANTRFDQDVQDGVRNHWVSESADDVRKVVTYFGDGELLLPVYALTALLGPQLGSEVVGEWGERSLRAMAVGAPMLLALQRATGGSRPEDPLNQHSSKWVFLDSSHGVSGHAMVGSIAFLSMAKQSESPVLDVLLYAASALPALARVQGDRHYASQALMGWLLGYLATEAVDDNEQSMRQRRSTSWLPVLDGDTVGFAVVHRF